MDNIFNVDNLSADNNVENIHNIFEARNTLLCLTWDPRADESWTSQCMAKSASAVENGRLSLSYVSYVSYHGLPRMSSYATVIPSTRQKAAAIPSR